LRRRYGSLRHASEPETRRYTRYAQEGERRSEQARRSASPRIRAFVDERFQSYGEEEAGHRWTGRRASQCAQEFLRSSSAKHTQRRCQAAWCLLRGKAEFLAKNQSARRTSKRSPSAVSLLPWRPRSRRRQRRTPCGSAAAAHARWWYRLRSVQQFASERQRPDTENRDSLRGVRGAYGVCSSDMSRFLPAPKRGAVKCQKEQADATPRPGNALCASSR